MRPLFVLLLMLVATGVEASESAESTLSENEVALQAKISRLETQLENVNARQTISGLENELDATRNALAVSETPANVVGETRSAGSRWVGSGDSLEASLQAPIDPSPASITRLSAEKLALGGVKDLSRMEYLVPGLRYGQTGNDVRLSMRGARTNSIGPEAVSAVGIITGH